jgi:hypothetical protein
MGVGAETPKGEVMREEHARCTERSGPGRREGAHPQK